MRIHYYFLFFVLFCIATTMQAAPLNGTAAVVYEASSYAFANGDYARGFVRLNNGCSVPAGSTVNFNILVPVAGDINLNTTGKITLEGDLCLTSSATISTGGIIDGKGECIIS
jgi:hypothetical protein